ncbi:MAG: substrate-binding domain-containing protein [Bacteroidia bacterium]|nr:substrate-binding domain-containing protein [Bacteroidia bacterium]
MSKLCYLALVILLFSCNQQPSQTYDETPTRGNIKIACDESFKLLFDTEIYTFESLYKFAKINPTYLPENDLFNLFFNDSVRLIVTTRKLTKSEEDGLVGNNIVPKTTVIAYDALAFIINNDNTDTTIIYSNIKKIFTGEIKTWKDLNPKSELGDIAMVFDNEKSGNVRYINEKFELKQGFPSTCFAVNSNEEVINYVEKNKNAIGLLSVNYISDRHDSLTINFLNRIKVLAISAETDDGTTGYYFRPYQAYIANVSYPFRRDVYIISRETFTGLGSGFKQFVAGEVGQRIILKSGLVPSNMPIRLIQLSNE